MKTPSHYFVLRAYEPQPEMVTEYFAFKGVDQPRRERTLKPSLLAVTARSESVGRRSDPIRALNGPPNYG